MDSTTSQGPDDPPRRQVDAEDVWRRHAPAAIRYATVLVGPHDAHDVTVNAFVRISNGPGWANVVDPLAYLMRSITNEAHNLRRSRRRRLTRDLAAITPSAVAAPDPHLDLRRCVAGLSVQQRAVVFLAYWEDLSEQAIAELLDLSPGTVHRHLTRAREALRKALT